MMLEFHPVADVFPLLQGAEFDALVESVKSNGLLNAITLHPDGSVVDGRNRYRACLEAGVEPRFVTWDGKGSLISFVVAQNIDRRHLNGTQRALLAKKLEPLYAAEAKGRGDEIRRQQGARGKEGGRGKKKPIQEKVPERVYVEQARDKAAKKAGSQPALRLRPEKDREGSAGGLREDRGRRDRTAEGEAPVRQGRGREEAAGRKSHRPSGDRDLRPARLLHGATPRRSARPGRHRHGPAVSRGVPAAVRRVGASGCGRAQAGRRAGGDVRPELSAADRGGDVEAHDIPMEIAYLTPGGQSVQLWERKVNTFWKPVLVFGGQATVWIGDVVESDVNANDKRFHDGARRGSGFERLVGVLTEPGQLVCDPFLGAGTTAVACMKLSRRFVGCDVDAAQVEKARARATLAQEQATKKPESKSAA